MRNEAEIENAWFSNRLNNHLDSIDQTQAEEDSADAATAARAEELESMMPFERESMQAIAELMAEDNDMLTALAGFVATSEPGESVSVGITIECIVRKLIKAKAREYAEEEAAENKVLKIAHDAPASYWEDEILNYQ